MPVTVETPVEKWAGTIRPITVGATAGEGGTRGKAATIGGETTLPFLGFEGKNPNVPLVAVEVWNRNPGEEWSAILKKWWGDALNDPALWAKQAEAAGADVICLRFFTTDAAGARITATAARATLRCVLEATKLPLIVLGPGQAELDNEVLVACAEEGAGEKLLLGPCEDKNYRTIVAAAMANGHLVTAKTPMDVNLAKQLNILIHDMGMPMERIVIDPTTGVARLRHRVRLQRHGTAAPCGAAGRRHDPAADAGDPRRRGVARERGPHGRGRACGVGRLGDSGGQLGNHDGRRANRVGCGHRGAAASRDGAADQAADCRPCSLGRCIAALGGIQDGPEWS